MDVIEKMKKEMLRRKYSVRTVKTYVDCVRLFINKNHKDVRKYSKKDVREHLEGLAVRGAAGSTINVHLQALKFMMLYVLNKKVYIDIRFSKTNRKCLPVVLTKAEVFRLFDAIKNDKHKLMIKLLYSAGLRVSELLNLKIRDLDLGNNFGWVRKGKGNKDRPFIIAKSIKDDLAKCVLYRCPDEEVFSGRRGRLSVRTVQVIVKRAAKNAGINKNVHPHTLRHSFATHLIEDGYAVGSVQSLLGHNSPDTTMVYVHVASPKLLNVKSPLDN